MARTKSRTKSAKKSRPRCTGGKRYHKPSNTCRTPCSKRYGYGFRIMKRKSGSGKTIYVCARAKSRK